MPHFLLSWGSYFTKDRVDDIAGLRIHMGAIIREIHSSFCEHFLLRFYLLRFFQLFSLLILPQHER